MLGEGWTIKSAHQNNAGVVDSITAENADGISFTYTLASNSNPDPITIKKPNIGGEVEVKPVANNVPNSGNDLANGTMPGFSGMQGIDTSKLPVGTKLTAMTVELPLDNGKFYAVKEINSALATCHVGTANGTAGEDNGKYIKFATLTGSTTNTAKSFRLAVMVTDDKKPITLEVYSATTQIWDAMDQDGNKDKGNGWLNVYKSTTAGDTHDGLTLEYTITIDTTGITFDTP